jgi:hypothetical protein
MCLSAWEAFIEEITKEAIESFRPTGVNPPPTIHNHYSHGLPRFFRRLGHHGY